MKESFIDERTGIEYIKHGDYYLPNLIDTASVCSRKLGKYGRMRLNYLKEHKYAEYIILWSQDKLRKHLKDIDSTANSRFDLLMKQFTERENITEELKATNQLEWVCRMNSIKNRVEDIILNELIYM